MIKQYFVICLLFSFLLKNVINKHTVYNIHTIKAIDYTGSGEEYFYNNMLIN